jgi:tRNA (guanosine-2'-O-)-methyltransferase
MKQLGPTDLKRLHRSWQRRTVRRVALLLDGVQSPFNVGAIVRTAAALRVDHLYLAGSTVSPAHPKAGKTAMGTERYLTWSTFDAATDAVTAAKGDGYLVVGLELAEGATPLHELTLASGAEVCLAVGNEDHGLSAAALSTCDAVGYLPQLGRVGSLNVATATAMALYEVRRREWAAPPEV